MALEFKTEKDLNNAIEDLSNSKYKLLYKNLIDYINKADILLTQSDNDFIKEIGKGIVSTIYRKEIVTNSFDFTYEINKDLDINTLMTSTNLNLWMAVITASLSLVNTIPVLEYEYKYNSELKKYKLTKIYLYYSSVNDISDSAANKTLNKPVAEAAVAYDEFIDEFIDGEIFYYVGTDGNRRFIVYNSDKEAFLDLDRIKTMDFLNTELPKKYIGNITRLSRNIVLEYVKKQSESDDYIHNYSIDKFLVYPIMGYFDYMHLTSTGFTSVREFETSFKNNINNLISTLTIDESNLGIFENIIYTDSSDNYEMDFENSRWLGSLKKKDFLYNNDEDRIVELSLNNKLHCYDIVTDQSRNTEIPLLIPSLYISEADMKKSIEYLAKTAVLVLKDDAANFMPEDEEESGVNWGSLKDQAAELKNQLSTFDNIETYITEGARETLKFLKSAGKLVYEQLNLVTTDIKKKIMDKESFVKQEKELEILDFLSGDTIFVAFKTLYNIYKSDDMTLKTSFQINNAKFLAILNEIFEYDDKLLMIAKLQHLATNSVEFKNLYEKTVGKIKNDSTYEFFK